MRGYNSKRITCYITSHNKYLFYLLLQILDLFQDCLTTMQKRVKHLEKLIGDLNLVLNT